MQKLDERQPTRVLRFKVLYALAEDNIRIDDNCRYSRYFATDEVLSP